LSVVYGHADFGVLKGVGSNKTSDSERLGFGREKGVGFCFVDTELGTMKNSVDIVPSLVERVEEGG
jgi:hypothetical protein